MHENFARGASAAFVFIMIAAVSGCTASKPLTRAAFPKIAPEQIETEKFVPLDRSHVPPMFSELLPIDLPTVFKVASAENLDIQQARVRVEAARGKLQSSIGGAFPVFAPTALFEQVDGTVRATKGDLLSVDFKTFQPYMLAQWVINPGKVYHDIVAARKRVLASRYQERAILQQTLRMAIIQYYELVLAQSRVAAVYQALAQSQELQRITQSRAREGAGLAADELRAQAELAGREQDLIVVLRGFYDASVALALTLRLESMVTLVPSAERMAQTTLVRTEMPIEDLLALALEHRDDLHAARTLVVAARNEKKSTWWGGLGASTQVGVQSGGILGQAHNVKGSGVEHFDLEPQDRLNASARWKLGLFTFGELKNSKAAEQQAYIEAERKLDLAKAEVVRAMQDGRSYASLIEKSNQQLKAADEAVRLSGANLRAGTMTVLDVLTSQTTLASARLRHYESIVRYNQAQVNLLAALGMVREDSVFPTPPEKLTIQQGHTEPAGVTAGVQHNAGISAGLPED